MTHVADEALGKLARQQADLFRRVREGSIDPVLAGRLIQDVLIDGKHPGWAGFIDGKCEIRQRGSLRLLSAGQKIIIPPCDGKKTIAQANDVFDRISHLFEKCGLDTPSKPTSTTTTQVWGLEKDGRFNQVFLDAISGGSLEMLCLTQHQIILFSIIHRFWMEPPDNGNYFLIKKRGQFFVVRVDVDGGSLPVSVERFSDELLYCQSRPRFILPEPRHLVA